MTKSMDQNFLIDVSEEDDSLLPTADKVTNRNFDDLLDSVKLGHQECNAEGTDATKEKLPMTQPVCISEEPVNLALPVLPENPAVVKKKKKSGFNVRKSMAWNNAFLTDEGVLDSEELLLVNNTFQKPFGLPKQSNPKKPPTSTLQLPKPPLMRKVSLASHRAGLNAESKEHVINQASSSFRGSTETLFGSHPSTGTDSIKHKVSPSLSLGSMASGKKESHHISGHADSSESKLHLLRRSIDKNEHALNTITSRGGMQLKHAMNNTVPVGHIPSLEASRPPSFTNLTMERVSSTSVLQAQPATGSMKLQKELSSSKTHPALKKSSPLEVSRASTSRDKPSGLRMPSPKLGFFDTNRVGSQVSVLCERKNGHHYGGSGPANRLGHSVVSAKSGSQLFEASKNQNNSGIKDLLKIPVASQVHGCSAEFVSHDLSKLASNVPASTSADRTEDILQARKIGNAAIRGKIVRGQPASSKGKGQENLLPNRNEGTGMPEKTTIAQGLAKGNPTIKASRNICTLEVKICDGHTKNTHLSSQNLNSHAFSASLHILKEQQNDEESNEGSRTYDVADNETASAIQPSPQFPVQKGGVVQNSPLEKASPQIDPWSPVGYSAFASIPIL